MNTTKQNIKKFKEVQIGDIAYSGTTFEKQGTIIGVHKWKDLPNWAKRETRAWDYFTSRDRKKGKYVIIENPLEVPQETVFLYNSPHYSVCVIKNPDDDCPVEALKAYLEFSHKSNIVKQGNELIIYTGDKWAVKVKVVGWLNPVIV